MNHLTTAFLTCMLSLGVSQVATAQSSLCKDKLRSSDTQQACVSEQSKSTSLCRDKHCSPKLSDVKKQTNIQRWEETSSETLANSKVYSKITVDENGKRTVIDVSLVRVEDENGMHFEYRYIDVDDVRVYSTLQENLEEDLETFSTYQLLIEDKIRTEKAAAVNFRE